MPRTKKMDKQKKSKRRLSVMSQLSTTDLSADGVMKIAEKLVKSQQTIREMLKESELMDVRSAIMWIGKELLVCADELFFKQAEVVQQQLVRPDEDQYDFLLTRISTLGHHFADVVQKHLKAPKLRVHAIENAIIDLEERLRAEFDLEAMADGMDITTRLLGLFFWKRYLSWLLITAAARDNIDLARHLVQIASVLPNQARNGITPLHSAGVNKSQAVALFLIQSCKQKKLKVNLVTQSGHTPLHDAAAYGSELIARALCDTDPTMIHQQTEDGWTPILLAAANGHYNTVSLLLWKGSSLLVKNRWGHSSLDYARMDAQLWEVLVENIPGLEGMSHRALRDCIIIVNSYEAKFHVRHGQKK